MTITGHDEPSADATIADIHYCSASPPPPRMFAADVSAERAQSIQRNDWLWANQTVIHYYFMTGANYSQAQCDVVNDAFQLWRSVGIGLDFHQVTQVGDADVRIQFDRADNESWSRIAREAWCYRSPGDPTTKFGLDLLSSWGRATAIHEIGHIIGLRHEHQNPLANIVWDRTAVLNYFREKQRWDDAFIEKNVLNTDPVAAQRGKWDVYSIMEYPFEPGLINSPTDGHEYGIKAIEQISDDDQRFVKSLYPPTAAAVVLEPMSLRKLNISPGDQADFVVTPDRNQKCTFSTVGLSDSRMVLFEERDGRPRFLAADHDLGQDRNASITARLVPGRRYFLRVRLHYISGPQGFGVMMV